MKNTSSMCFLVCKMDYRAMTPGWQGAPYFRRYGRELVSTTGDFVEKKIGGATAERLPNTFTRKIVILTDNFTLEEPDRPLHFGPNSSTPTARLL